MRIGTTNDKFSSIPVDCADGVCHTDFAKMRSLGYTAMDSSSICDGSCYLIAKASEEEFETFLTEERRLAEENGIWINQVHGPWPCYDHIVENREINFEHMKKCVRGAALLGAETIVCHPVMPEGWGEETDAKFAWDMNVSIFSQIGEYAKDYNIKISIENLPFPAISLSKVEEIRKLVDTIDMPNVGICLDTGHANVLGNPDIGDIVKICGDKLFCLHVHDNKAFFDDSHQVPFLCRIDWHKFMKALKEIGYKGVLSLESTAYGRLSMPQHLLDMFLKFEFETAKYLASLMDD